MKLTRAQRLLSRADRSRQGFLETLILWAVFFVASQLLKPKPEIEDAKPAGLGDFNFPTATEARHVQMLWGTVRVDGANTIWYDDILQTAITEKVKTGLFSSENVTKGFQYSVGFQLGLGRDIGLNGGTELTGFWVEDDRVFTGTVTHGNTFTIDEPELFGGLDNGNGGFKGTFEFFDGNSTQAASTYLSAFQKEPALTGDTPAYRGTIYIAPETEPVYIGNSTGVKPFKIELKRIPNGLGLSVGNSEVNGSDANIMNVMYELFTDKLDGLGYETSSIDTANWTTAAATLASEGNGFSYVLDRQIETVDLIKILEEQMDGVMYFDQTDKKWKVKLARDDYTIGNQLQLDETNVREVVNFSRGSWENTTNVVRLQFVDRDDDYKQTYAVAMDQANIRLQNGVVIASEISYPGVMNATTANNLAWRQLRALSYPLAKATLQVDRDANLLIVGEVVAFSNTALGITQLPMRVIRVNKGNIDKGTIRVDLVQDVYTSQTASFDDPPPTGWSPPADTLVAFPSGQQFAFEAPRAIVSRDPVSPALPNRIWGMARRQGVEVQFLLRERNAVGTPSGAYTEVGGGYAFTLLGTLNTALSTGSPYPLSSFLVVPSTDSQSAIEEFIEDLTDPVFIGTNLANLLVIDPGGTNEEYILVTSATTSGANVSMANAYRGVLDTVQRDHLSGAEVWMVQATISTTAIPETNNVDVKLLPKSLSDEVDEGDATTIVFQMDKRYRRPYAPASLDILSTTWPSTSALEGSGSDAEDYHLDLSVVRRDFRLTDEVASLSTDAESIDPGFPAANTTTHEVDVRNDPDGTNTLLFTQAFSGIDTDVLRLEILKETDGALPTRLRFAIRASHTEASEVLESRADLVWDFDVTSTLTGQFEFTALDTNDISAVYTTTVTGSYAFTLSSAFVAGDVEYRIDGGTWTTLIAAATTSGTIVGVTSGETIEVRHTSSDTTTTKQLDMTAAGAGQDGFAILFT